MPPADKKELDLEPLERDDHDEDADIIAELETNYKKDMSAKE